MSAGTHLEQLARELRDAVRMLRADRTVVGLSILTLAVGIGAATTAFTLLNVLLLRQLPVRAPHELVELRSIFPGEPSRVGGFPMIVYEHYRDHNGVFSDLIGTTVSRFRVGREDGEAEEVDAAYVTGNYFSGLGLTPAAGRLIGAGDDRTDGPAPVVVLSWAYWQQRFNGDPAAIGSSLVVEGRPATIIGVAPRPFTGVALGVQPKIWAPVAMASTVPRGPAPDSQTQVPAVGLIGRLRPGVSLAQARAELSVLDRFRVDLLSSRSSDPQTKQLRLDLAPAATGFSVLRELWSGPLFALMAVIAVMLLIACINVAIMLLARGAARQRDVAIRVSLGAGRIRLARQIAIESLLLSTVAAALGTALAGVGAKALVQILISGSRFPGGPQQLQIDVPLDGHVLAFTVAMAVLTGLVFGSAPAWHMFSTSPVAILLHDGQRSTRRGPGGLLVVAQVVLSIVLLSAAGALAGHLFNLRDRDAGFRRDSVLLVGLQPQGSGYSRQQLTAIYKDVLNRLRMIHGVRVATLSAIVPVSGAGWSRFIVAEGFHEPPEQRRYVSLNAVAPGYFAAFGTPLRAGRDFAMEDEGRTRVAIVNEALARHYFASVNPIGRRVTVDGDDRPYEIVGVAADARYENLREPAPRTLYLHAFQDGQIGSQFALRTEVPPMAIAAEVQQTIRETASRLRIGKITTFAELVDATVVPERLLSTLSGAIGGLGALLVAVGLFGVMSHRVTLRVREIGIRMALGATARDVVLMVLHGAATLVFAGLIVGAPLAFSTRRLIESWIPISAGRVSPLLLAAVVIAIVGLAAGWLPAWRAGRIRPGVALRQ